MKSPAASKAQPPARPPPPRWRKPLLALGAVALALSVLAGPQIRDHIVQEPPSPSGLHPASGYTGIIKVFAERGWLIPHLHHGENAPFVTVSRRVSHDLYRFYRTSFLRADVQALKESIWVLSDGLVRGVDPSAHTVAGPFARGRIWEGELLFADARQSLSLRGPAGVFVLTDRPAGWKPEDPPLALQSIAAFSTTGDAQSAWPAFSLRDRQGHEIASILRVGEAAVVRRESGSSGEVWMGSERLQPAAQKTTYRVLLPGEPLILQADGHLATYGLDLVQPSISSYRRGGDRMRDSASESLARGFEAAMARAVEQGQPDPGLMQQSVRTTLEEGLQRDAQHRLGDTCTALRPRTRQPDQPMRTFRCAALVMDGLSGDVLAAASFPSHLDDLLPPEQTSRTARAMLERNHNFIRLPIGSVAKIPFSAAITNANPGLLKLSITGTPYAPGATSRKFDVLMGQPLESPVVEDSGASLVNFDTFIRTSCNKFASTLMLLASARDPLGEGGFSAGEGYSIDGHKHTTLPVGAFHTVGAAGEGRLERVAGAADAEMGWLQDLRDLFGIQRLGGAADRGAEEAQAGRAYDLGVWRNLAFPLGADVAGSLAIISPEREAFAMGAIKNLRNDYLELIMGGGDSRWTTFKIAEVFSRLVTGRRIEANIVMPGGARRAATALPFRPGSGDPNSPRMTLLAGMEHVWNNKADGTARALAPQIEQLQRRLGLKGETLRVFAKTGTPSLEQAPPSDANAAINELMGLGVVVYDPDMRRLSIKGHTDIPGLASALGRDPDAPTVLAEHNVSVAKVARYLAERSHAVLVIQDPDEPEAGYRLRSDGLERGEGSVLALAFAVYPKGQTDVAHPRRLVTVVINIQGREYVALPAHPRNEAITLLQGWLGGSLGDRIAGVTATEANPA